MIYLITRGSWLVTMKQVNSTRHCEPTAPSQTLRPTVPPISHYLGVHHRATQP